MIPSEFKSRFQPPFKPETRIFEVHKDLAVQAGELRQGDFFIPELHLDVDSRRLKQLFEQRFLVYPSNIPAAEKVLTERLEAHKKAQEEAAKASQGAPK